MSRLPPELSAEAATIGLARSDAEIAAAYPVMRELRADLREAAFVSRVRSQQQGGYLLACLRVAGRPVAVAGFRLGQRLSWGRYPFVEDLVTLPAHRALGYGARLFSWLEDFAARQGCEQIHLDSGLQRRDAHRFYERQGMEPIAYHFRKRQDAPR